MDKQGVMRLATQHSAEPLLLNVSHIGKVIFKNSVTSSAEVSQRLVLSNGDSLPVSVERLDAQAMEVTSPAMGSLKIPREQIDSLELGLFKQTKIYSGPSDFKLWKRDRNGSRNWSLEDRVLSVRGSGEISRDVDLPDKYILRFRIQWQTRPDLKISFGDPLDDAGVQNRYWMEFDSSGVDIKRESITAKRFTPIVFGQKPARSNEKKLAIEIRVDRSLSRLDLYIDGSLVGRFTDPIPDTPSGSGISIHSSGDADLEQSIDRIEITEWDERSDRYRSEIRGDPTKDSVIDRMGDRFGGRLVSIAKNEEGKIYIFRSDFHDQPIELTQAQVSTIFFAKNPETKTASGDLVIHLSGDGKLHVTECQFEKDFITAVHSSLGTLKINRSAVTRLERSEAAKEREEIEQ